jgi:hypothetical protein
MVRNGRILLTKLSIQRGKHVRRLVVGDEQSDAREIKKKLQVPLVLPPPPPEAEPRPKFRQNNKWNEAPIDREATQPCGPDLSSLSAPQLPLEDPHVIHLEIFRIHH